MKTPKEPTLASRSSLPSLIAALAGCALSLFPACALESTEKETAVSYAFNETIDTGLNPAETFTAEDSPALFSVDGKAFTAPWGYGRPANADRLYPLLVSGFWGDGQGAYTAQDRSFNKRFPAFTLDWQKDGVSDGEDLADLIDSAIASGYRIDPSRIYLTGFSRGGSGSFPLAKGMGNRGKYFAAILRMAGQSQSDLGNGIAARTALWYHIGLQDEPQRVTVARAALENFRAYESYSGAVERQVTDGTCGVSRTSITLYRAGKPDFRYSEYDGMGHESGTCYRDPELFTWLFNRKLK